MTPFGGRVWLADSDPARARSRKKMLTLLTATKDIDISEAAVVVPKSCSADGSGAQLR